MAIFAAVPFTLSNGSLADATQVMANFNQIVANGNANAAPLASPAFSGTVTMPDAGTWAGTGIANLVSLGVNAAAPGTGIVNPTGGLVGVTTNSNAAAGQIGEYGTNSAGSQGMSNGIANNLAQNTFGAGDWDVWGNIAFTPAGGTTVTAAAVGLSTTTGTLPAGTNDGSMQEMFAAFATSQNLVMNCGVKRFSVATTQTVYLVGLAGFGVSTMAAVGLMAWRRVR